MRNLKIGVSALVLPVLTAVTIAIANPPGQNGQQDPTARIPKTWDDQAMATLELPLAEAAASPVPVSGDYYYRIPVRPSYKTYPVYHPSKEHSDYFEGLKTLGPEIVRLDSSTLRTENDWIRAGEIVFDLIIVDAEAAGERRYRFLETVRQYGRERLLRSGDAERVRDRHLSFFSELVRRAELELQKADQVFWLNRLQREYDNVRSALDWCLAVPQRGDTGFQLAAALTWFWIKRGYFAEGRQWLERALAATERSSRLRAKALNSLSCMAVFQADYNTTLARSDESIALGRKTGDLRTTAHSLFLQGVVAVQRGDLEQITRLALESQTAAIASEDLWVQAHPLELLGFVAVFEGHYDRAAQVFNDALELFRRSGDIWGISRMLTNLGQVSVLQGQNLRAKALAAEGIALSQELGDRREVALYLEIFAAADAGQGDIGRAARLWGASDRLLESVGSPLQPENALLRDRYFESAKASLGDNGFQAALSEGRAMSLREAIQHALEDQS
jgi:tetratricopeptide (TPR) repeat protein